MNNILSVTLIIYSLSHIFMAFISADCCLPAVRLSSISSIYLSIYLSFFLSFLALVYFSLSLTLPLFFIFIAPHLSLHKRLIFFCPYLYPYLYLYRWLLFHCFAVHSSWYSSSSSTSSYSLYSFSSLYFPVFLPLLPLFYHSAGGRLKDDGKLWLPSSVMEANVERKGEKFTFCREAKALESPFPHIYILYDFLCCFCSIYSFFTVLYRYLYPCNY